MSKTEDDKYARVDYFFIGEEISHFVKKATLDNEERDADTRHKTDHKIVHMTLDFTCFKYGPV